MQIYQSSLIELRLKFRGYGAGPASEKSKNWGRQNWSSMPFRHQCRNDLYQDKGRRRRGRVTI